MADAIKDCSRRGAIILDPFGGSGTTMIAAQKSGRLGRLMKPCRSRAPTGDTEGVNAENIRNKKKAFAAMALVALATPQLRQSRTLTPLIKVRIQVPQPVITYLILHILLSF